MIRMCLVSETFGYFIAWAIIECDCCDWTASSAEPNIFGRSEDSWKKWERPLCLNWNDSHDLEAPDLDENWMNTSSPGKGVLPWENNPHRLNTCSHRFWGCAIYKWFSIAMFDDTGRYIPCKAIPIIHVFSPISVSTLRSMRGCCVCVKRRG